MAGRERSSTSRSLTASASRSVAGTVDGGAGVSRAASAASSHASTPSTSPSDSRAHPMWVASSGTPAEHVVGQGAQPFDEGRGSGGASAPAAAPARRGQRRTRGHRRRIAWPMASARSPCVGVPLAGGTVQAGDPVGVLGSEPGAQRVGEQVVVAVPAGAGRRAGPGTGCPARGTPASAARRCGRSPRRTAGRSSGPAPRCRAGTGARRRAGGRAPPRPGSPGRTGGCR